MSWVRIGQVSAESRSIREYIVDSVMGNGSPIPTNESSYTGSWSVRVSPSGGNPNYPSPFGLSVPGASTVRIGFFIRHNSTGGASDTPLIRVRNISVLATVVANNSSMKLFVDGTLRQQKSLEETNFSRLNTWMHIGFVYSKSSSFVSMYIDGQKVLSYEGVMPTQPVTSIFVCGSGSGFVLWRSPAFVDDLYCDVWDGSGTLIDAPPPSRRFYPMFVTANGASVAWTPNSGTNFSAVSEAPPNDDTTYVQANGAGLLDRYVLSDVTLDQGYVPRAVIGYGYARKSDAGTDSRLRINAYNGASSTVLEGSDQALTTSYGFVWERWATNFDNQPWTLAQANNVELGFLSTGEFE